jgi:hypothetical protein
VAILLILKWASAMITKFQVFIILCFIAAILGYSLDDITFFSYQHPVQCSMLFGSMVVFIIVYLCKIDEKEN